MGPPDVPESHLGLRPLSALLCAPPDPTAPRLNPAPAARPALWLASGRAPCPVAFLNLPSHPGAVIPSLTDVAPEPTFRNLPKVTQPTSVRAAIQHESPLLQDTLRSRVVLASFLGGIAETPSS